MAEISIKPKFKMAEVKKAFKEFEDHINDHVVEVLKKLADRSADDLRKNADFLNHSFNLRSSLGTVVFRDGVIVHQNFLEVGGGAEGLRKGKEVAEANVPQTGIGMMLIAGEDYALYVEAKDNKWVISGSSIELSRTLQKLI